MSTFSYADFRAVELSDRAILEPVLSVSDERSCEFCFVNLYAWGQSCGTHWQEYNGKLWFHLKHSDELLVAGEPTLQDLREVSAELRRQGFTGRFGQIREKTLAAMPGVHASFEVRTMEEARWEYIYDVEELAHMQGVKFSTLRHHVAQFRREFPHYWTRPLEPALLPACRELARQWRPAEPNPEMLSEGEALERCLEAFTPLGAEGLALFSGDALLGFSVVAPLAGEMFDEPFEKARHDCRGAAQMLLLETAKYLSGRCRLLNREQDLGLPGLRRAKHACGPQTLLQNCWLIPIETIKEKAVH